MGAPTPEPKLLHAGKKNIALLLSNILFHPVPAVPKRKLSAKQSRRLPEGEKIKFRRMTKKVHSTFHSIDVGIALTAMSPISVHADFATNPPCPSTLNVDDTARKCGRKKQARLGPTGTILLQDNSKFIEVHDFRASNDMLPLPNMHENFCKAYILPLSPVRDPKTFSPSFLRSKSTRLSPPVGKFRASLLRVKGCRIHDFVETAPHKRSCQFLPLFPMNVLFQTYHGLPSLPLMLSGICTIICCCRNYLT